MNPKVVSRREPWWACASPAKALGRNVRIRRYRPVCSRGNWSKGNQMDGSDGGLIYGIRLRGENSFRYVGLTTKTASIRLSQHFKVAASGRKTPFYDWLRKHFEEDVVVQQLERVDNLEELGQAEIRWIASLKSRGHPLLNISEGGLGPTGVIWSSEMREAASLRSIGRKGLSRPGERNPFYGKTHSDAQRAKWSAERKGTNSGAANPNFGKFGINHPSYGHKLSEETIARLSEGKLGAKNPNFGKRASAETREKMSRARKGQPKPSSRRSAHTRHHTNKDIFKATCRFCQDDYAAGAIWWAKYSVISSSELRRSFSV